MKYITYLIYLLLHFGEMLKKTVSKNKPRSVDLNPIMLVKVDIHHVYR